MESKQLIKNDDVQLQFDLETMGLRTATAPIISIGAVKFTLNDGIIDKFKVNISLKDQVENYGKIAEKSTMEWWAKQGDALTNSMTNAVPTVDALKLFTKFVGNDVKWVSANGIDFDSPKLTELYISVYGAEASVPWNYWNQIDYRTILTIFGYQNFQVRKMQAEKQGLMYHDALSDTIGQVEFMIPLLKALYV